MIEYNRKMAKRVDISVDACLERLVSPQQKEAYTSEYLWLWTTDSLLFRLSIEEFVVLEEGREI
ncbi:MAG: hypothetical protein ACKVOY_07520 [Burkholderiaceae bacterium]